MDERYDVFITYRAGPDFAQASALYEIFKSCDLKPALDCYDFSPAETFLDEMARCVSESRYTVALISPRYATSQFTQEEAIMQKILDNRDKKRRLLPIYIEDCQAPLWMQSLVGVRLFRDKDDAKRPELRRLVKLIANKDTEDPAKAAHVEAVIDRRWSQLSSDILKYGLYGAAGYGVLSVLADLDLDTAKDAAKETLGDAIASGAEHAHTHVVDNIHGIAQGLGRVVKNLLDDIF